MVCLYVAIVVIAVLGGPIGYFDESIMLVSARLVQQGFKPHIDFWSTYPPVYYYVAAAAFGVFGQTVLVYRCLNAFLYVFFLLFTSRFFWSEFPHFRRLIPCTVLLAAVGIGPNMNLQFWPAYATAWLALLTYLQGWRGSDAARCWKIALSGLLAGGALGFAMR